MGPSSYIQMDYDLNVKPRSTREKDRINVAIRALECQHTLREIDSLH